jgi:hypothetical protein
MIFSVESDFHLMTDRSRRSAIGSKCRRLSKAVFLGQILKHVEFTADKQKKIQHVQQWSRDNADGKEILSTLQNIEDKQYQNVAQVTKAAGVVHT